MTVHIWPHTQNPKIASYRLHCLRVMRGLVGYGIDARQYSKGDAPERLVLSKRYDTASIQTALELKEKYGTQLYLDICDNHFHFSAPEPAAVERAERLRSAIRAVDVVIASSEYLAEVIRNESGTAKPVVVIGDLVEFPHDPALIEKIGHPIHWLRMRNLKHSLDRLGNSKSTRLIWFGNHGGAFADGGMNDIESIRQHLENVHKKTPISLTVMSNSREKFWKLTAGWGVPAFYVPWNKVFFSSILRLHGLSVIPIKQNPFTLAKTGNRVETSLVHGLSVIADRIPSYIEFEKTIFLGEWEKNLPALVNDEATDFRETITPDFHGKNAGVMRAWVELFGLPPAPCDSAKSFCPISIDPKRSSALE